jgi:hypothetical protein
VNSDLISQKNYWIKKTKDDLNSKTQLLAGSLLGFLLVGAAGLEPATPRSQSGCATTAPRPDTVVYSVIGTKQPNYCMTVNADSHNPIGRIIDKL